MNSLRRILHVEDVPSIQVITRIALEKLGGFEVRTCSSAQQALDEAADFAPDLILLDVMLPQMDGVELLHALGERLDLTQVPVVFLTGQTQLYNLEQLQEQGLRAVIKKPFDPLQLARQLRDIWDAAHG